MTTRYQAIKLAAIFGFALGAAGCASSQIESIPQWAGGEPTATPPRLASELQYPPVNDRPPPRETKPVSFEEQARMEKELVAARDVQAKKNAQMKKDRATMLSNMPKPQPKPAPVADKTYPENTPTN